MEISQKEKTSDFIAFISTDLNWHFSTFSRKIKKWVWKCQFYVKFAKITDIYIKKRKSSKSLNDAKTAKS